MKRQKLWIHCLPAILKRKYIVEVLQIINTVKCSYYYIQFHMFPESIQRNHFFWYNTFLFFKNLYANCYISMGKLFSLSYLACHSLRKKVGCNSENTYLWTNNGLPSWCTHDFRNLLSHYFLIITFQNRSFLRWVSFGQYIIQTSGYYESALSKMNAGKGNQWNNEYDYILKSLYL